MTQNTKTNQIEHKPSESQSPRKEQSLFRRAAKGLGITALVVAGTAATNEVIQDNFEPRADKSSSPNNDRAYANQADNSAGETPNIVDHGETQAQMEDGTKLQITNPPPPERME